MPVQRDLVTYSAYSAFSATSHQRGRGAGLVNPKVIEGRLQHEPGFASLQAGWGTRHKGQHAFQCV